MYSRGAINGDLVNVFECNGGAFLFEDLAGATVVAVEADNRLAIMSLPHGLSRMALRGPLDVNILRPLTGTAQLALRARLHTAQQVTVEAVARLRVTTCLTTVMAWLRPATSRVVVKREHRSILVPSQDQDAP